jgi:hypothetical protein
VDVIMGVGWTRAHFVSHNDGSVPYWGPHCPQTKMEIVLDNPDFLELFETGQVYDFPCFRANDPNQGPQLKEEEPNGQGHGLSKSSGADQPTGAGEPGPGERHPGLVDAKGVTPSEEVESQPGPRTAKAGRRVLK